MIILELLLFLITMQATAYFGRTDSVTSSIKIIFETSCRRPAERECRGEKATAG